MSYGVSFKDIMRDMEHGVYDYTKDGKCSGCGACCSALLPVSEKEVREIRKYVKKHHIKEHKHFAPTTETTLDLTCPFMNDDKEKDKCEIYPVRPKICRVFICNQPPSKVKENKEIFWRTRIPVDMRDTFFGNSK